MDNNRYYKANSNIDEPELVQAVLGDPEAPPIPSYGCDGCYGSDKSWGN